MDIWHLGEIHGKCKRFLLQSYYLAKVRHFSRSTQRPSIHLLIEIDRWIVGAGGGVCWGVRSDEVHLYNRFIYSCIFWGGCFQEFDTKVKNHSVFVSGAKQRSSPGSGTDCRDLGTHCGRKSWWESRKEDIFLRGVIVSVFHNAQREDVLGKTEPV